jgi:hypothetical protein
MRYLCIIFLLFTNILLQAQSEWAERTDSKGVTWRTNGKDSIWSFKKERAFMFRTGIGIQRSFYAELGISSFASTYSSHQGVASLGYYLSGEWTPAIRPSDYVFGIKGGAELIGSTGAMAVELKYQWNQVQNDFVFTPKYGFGLSHYAIFFYGYNLSINKNPFTRVRCHQFSLIFNINRRMFKEESKILRK